MSSNKSSDIQQFDCLTHEPEKDTFIIEASAGTGKTYSLMWILLKLIAKGVSLKKILLVTFTNNATDELKGRCRKNFNDALSCLSLSKTVSANVNSKFEQFDNTLQTWASQIVKGNNYQEVYDYLKRALSQLDSAHISTIHAFCQKILQSNPLTSNQLFNTQHNDKEKEITQTFINDFWRAIIQRQDITSEVSDLLHSLFKGPNDLSNLLKIPYGSKIIPDGDLNLDELVSQINKLLLQLKKLHQQWIDILKNIGIDNLLASKCFNGNSRGKIKKTWLKLNEGYQSVGSDDIKYLSAQSLHSKLKKNFKSKIKVTGQDEINKEYAEIRNNIKALVESVCYKYAQAKLKTYCEENGIITFKQQISGVYEQLKNKNFKQQLQLQFEAALVDEFQDIDFIQQNIIDTIFNTKQHYLYYVGDPKQSIYRFRGADIKSFYRIKNKLEKKHTFQLTNNYRSVPKLVGAVNSFFKENSFKKTELKPSNPPVPSTTQSGSISFTPAKSMVAAGKNILAEPKLSQSLIFIKTEEKTATDSQEIILLKTCYEIVRLLNCGTSITLNSQHRQIQPSDCCVIVHTNAESISYLNQLTSLNIPSCIIGADIELEYSSLRKPANELLILLKGLHRPRKYFNNLLSLSFFDLSIADLAQLAENQSAKNKLVEKINMLSNEWSQAGFAGLIEQLSSTCNYDAKLINESSFALVNFKQMVEIIQNAVHNNKLSPKKTIDWLEKWIADKAEVKPRLFDERNTVKIMTVHQAKGLEFPIVFYPSICKGLGKVERPYTFSENDNQITDLTCNEESKQKAARELYEERIRLIYVALTRAQLRCYIGIYFNPVKNFNENSNILASLLGFENRVSFFEKFANLAKNQSEIFAAFSIVKDELYNKNLQQTYGKNLQLLAAKAIPKIPKQSFQYTSYTRLSSQIAAETNLVALANLPIDSELDLSDTLSTSGKENDTNYFNSLPAGKDFGLLVHKLLDNENFIALAQGKAHLEKYFHKFNFDSQSINLNLLKELLQKTCTANLLPDKSQSPLQLCELNENQTIKEMPFSINIKSSFSLDHLTNIIEGKSKTTSKSIKESSQSSVFLTGFVDLIVQHNNKFYVVDYKTNLLQTYDTTACDEAMNEYYLQAWIYALALHLYLKGRINNYQPQNNLGGIIYYFVRGSFNNSDGIVNIDLSSSDSQRKIAQLNELATLNTIKET